MIDLPSRSRNTTAWLSSRSISTWAAVPAGRQHLIGDLSPEDCDAHLAGRLTLDGQPVIDADIRAAITARSHGLPYLLPLALEVLRLDPMAEGHMYEGDLLAAVLTRIPEIWSKSPELGRELRLIVSDLSDLTPNLKHEVERFLAL